MKSKKKYAVIGGLLGLACFIVLFGILIWYVSLLNAICKFNSKSELKASSCCELYGWAIPPVLVGRGENKRVYITEYELENIHEMNKYASVISINLNNVEISPEALKQLSMLSKIRYLNLSNSNANDSDMAILNNLKLLRDLNLDNCCIHGAGIANLSELKSLYRLKVANTKINDNGVKIIVKHFPNLHDLSLSGTKITDDSIKYIKTLPLNCLDISNTKITDVGIEELIKYRKKRERILTSLYINISETEVTEKGIKLIKHHHINIFKAGREDSSGGDSSGV